MPYRNDGSPERPGEYRDEKGRRLKLAVLALLASFVSVMVIYHFATDPISHSTENLMSDGADYIESGSDIDIKEIFPISRDTEKLMSQNTTTLQNPDFLIEDDTVFRTIKIGSNERRSIVETVAEKWPEERNPWISGYAGMCEKWVCDVYSEAGLPARGSCCATASKLKYASADGDAVSDTDIPSGAMIYSGEEYKSGYVCEICGRDPGHVAIYLGNGRIAGSQSPYIMTLDEYKDMFGYGGWAFGGNTYIPEE